MAVSEDELLVGALGHLGAGIGPGAAHGAEIAASRLRKNVFELELVVSIPPETAADRVQQVLAGQGRLVEAARATGDSPVQVVGIVGAGFANMNPAVVTVTIVAVGEGARIMIRGAAKEGLIKQRAGEKAAKRIAEAIS